MVAATVPNRHDTALASPVAFREKAPEPLFGEGLPPASALLLQARIKDLKLHLAGTRLEKFIHQLYEELEAAGISHRPECYLSDQWGCPSGVPVIGIPFYLADSEPAADRRRAGRGRRERARHHDVPAPRGRARLQLRLQALRDRRVEEALRRLRQALPRHLQAAPLQPEVRGPPLGLVRAEAPRRRLRRDLRGVDDARAATGPSATRAGARSRSCSTCRT